MAAIVTTLTAVCAGGNHLTFAITGAATREIVVDAQVVQEPIEERDIEGFLKVIVKLAKVGRTINQAKTALQAGVTVTA